MTGYVIGLKVETLGLKCELQAGHHVFAGFIACIAPLSCWKYFVLFIYVIIH